MSVNAPIAGGRVSAPDPIALGPIRHAGDGRTLATHVRILGQVLAHGLDQPQPAVPGA
jgi:hypothetical protein